MIISRTPFRVSFVGGGTDLRDYYSLEDGRVLSAGIDKYVYVTVKRQIGIVDYKYRIGWSRVEFKDRIDDIEHPIVREAFRLMEIDFPVEVTTIADVPASTGLGSSSSFAVGLLHALFALKGQMVTKSTLASMAAHIEVDILGRSIGKQDHFAAAYGNLNLFTFHPNETVTVEPVFYAPEFREKIEQNMMLFYTRLKRDAHEVLKNQKAKTQDKRETLRKMRDLAVPLAETFSNGCDLRRVGEILHEGWLLKKSITEEISSGVIDGYYERALKAGALGGKLLGAGGGGFLLFIVEPSKQQAVAKALSDLYQMHFKFDTGGTRITYYDQTVF
ncbi:MAG: hypothetical protein HGA80_02135 [Candidatus Omnitrophica bacterium]|nr:hypothetical protein [Candidatus Omnitrophota bacterium]